MTKTISVKELRLNMPEICEDLDKGNSFVVIRRSKPIARLEPIKQSKTYQGKKNIFELFADPPKEMLLKTKKSAVELVREERTR